ncbi:unnamed protein product [Trichogramma brassicae]|uniref:Uncharacterized protein n=1 Tax=Trichogramma brassicae TaxID=86971 RepID=A0A6H5IMS5_9HYME|nr:unnamed protein product [Trichogramma brassicae]
MESSDIPNCTARYRYEARLWCNIRVAVVAAAAVHITFFWTRRAGRVCTGAARVKTPPRQEAAIPRLLHRDISRTIDYNTLLRARELESRTSLSLSSRCSLRGKKILDKLGRVIRETFAGRSSYTRGKLVRRVVRINACSMARARVWRTNQQPRTLVHTSKTPRARIMFTCDSELSRVDSYLPTDDGVCRSTLRFTTSSMNAIRAETYYTARAARSARDCDIALKWVPNLSYRFKPGPAAATCQTYVAKSRNTQFRFGANIEAPHNVASRPVYPSLSRFTSLYNSYTYRNQTYIRCRESLLPPAISSSSHTLLVRIRGPACSEPSVSQLTRQVRFNCEIAFRICCFCTQILRLFRIVRVE